MNDNLHSLVEQYNKQLQWKSQSSSFYVLTPILDFLLCCLPGTLCSFRKWSESSEWPCTRYELLLFHNSVALPIEHYWCANICINQVLMCVLKPSSICIPCPWSDFFVIKGHNTVTCYTVHKVIWEGDIIIVICRNWCLFQVFSKIS